MPLERPEASDKEEKNVTIYTGCPHCDKSIKADISHKEIGAEPGKMRLAAKIKCEKCDGISDVFITILPQGEQQ